MAYLDALMQFLTFGKLAFCFLAYILYKVIAQVVYYRYFHPLRVFPGPFWASVTRLWIGWHCWRQTELETEKALHEKYGRLSGHCSSALLMKSSRTCIAHHSHSPARQ